jgi:transposase
MRKILEILRLHNESKLPFRAIARSCCISHNTVKDVLVRAEAAGIHWPLPEELTETELEDKLYPSTNSKPKQPEIDMSYIHTELRRKGVTLRLLWLEYKEQSPDGVQYSQFCDRYRRWRKQLDVSMRQVHRAGEKMFVDYAGQTVPIVDAKTGEIRNAQVFLAVLGASSYTYVNAYWQQALPEWIEAHIDAFEYFGGVPEIVVPDNLKSGVKNPCFYEPDLNPTYQDMATHYGAAIVPARVRKPKDKAKVESAVLLAERWILARLRNRTFYSLCELRQATAELLDKLNNEPFQKLEGSRRSQFEALDKPALKPLPTQQYEFAEWKKATVNIDYHIDLLKNFYSVPHQLVKREVHVRYTATTVEIFFKGERVASHQRLHGKGKFITDPGHRPAAHRKYAEWTPSRIISWCESVGFATGELATHILETKPHPEQGYRSCLGLIKLGKQYSQERLEIACRRALAYKAFSYQSVKSILSTGLDQLPLDKAADSSLPKQHENLRGSEYYQEEGA